jgi:hypothetical protein
MQFDLENSSTLRKLNTSQKGPMMRPLLSSLHQQRGHENKNMDDGKNGAHGENAD